MRKHLVYIILPMVLLCSCAKSDGPKPDDHIFVSLTESEKQAGLYRDTIAPPNNPLDPGPGTSADEQYTVLGVLQVGKPASYSSRPVLYTLQSCQNYFLFDGDQMAYFSDSHLQGLHIGDTISVTGDVFCFNADGRSCYGIAMKEVQLRAPYQKGDGK